MRDIRNQAQRKQKANGGQKKKKFNKFIKEEEDKRKGQNKYNRQWHKKNRNRRDGKAGSTCWADQPSPQPNR